MEGRCSLSDWVLVRGTGIIRQLIRQQGHAGHETNTQSIASGSMVIRPGKYDGPSYYVPMSVRKLATSCFCRCNVGITGIRIDGPSYDPLPPFGSPGNDDIINHIAEYSISTTMVLCLPLIQSISVTMVISSEIPPVPGVRQHPGRTAVQWRRD